MATESSNRPSSRSTGKIEQHMTPEAEYFLKTFGPAGDSGPSTPSYGRGLMRSSGAR